RQPAHVVDFAIRGPAAVEVPAIPGRNTVGAIIWILCREKDLTGNHVGFADAVSPAALGNLIELAVADTLRVSVGFATGGDADTGGQDRCKPRGPAQTPPTPTPHHRRAPRSRRPRIIPQGLGRPRTRDDHLRRNCGRALVPVVRPTPTLHSRDA